MIYLITYTISKNRDYTPLYDAIKNSGTWWHYIDSSWIVKSDDTANTIFQRLKPLIDQKDDYLLVIKVDPSSRQGWLPRKAWDWFRNNSN